MPSVIGGGFLVCPVLGLLPLTEMPSYLRLCIEVKDLTPTGLLPHPKGLRVFTRGRPTGSLHITAIVRIKIIVDYDKYTVSSPKGLS